MRQLHGVLVLAVLAGCPAIPPAPPTRIHEAVAAGTFYPRDAQALRETVHALVSRQPRVAQAPVRAVLAPHAAYVYSAPIAAAAFRQLEPGFQRVVVVAGNHSDVPFDGASVDLAAAYRVPGLEVKVASAARELARHRLFVDAPAAHRSYVVEVELPFLAEVNQAPFELVPIIVGHLTPATTRELATLLAPLADAQTRFVFSVDLSHFFTAAQALEKDRACLAALEAMDLDRVEGCDTDATQVLEVMTHLAALQGWTPRVVAQANSGDVPEGDRARVVGYGALVQEEGLRLTDGEGGALLDLARRALDTRVCTGRSLEVPAALLARLPRLALPRATFVTLQKHGALRGCIGTLAAEEALAVGVVESAQNAAVRDSRFEPVRVEELADLALTVSVLEPPRALEVRGQAVLPALSTRPGVVLTTPGGRSVFLPEVWEQLPEPAEFLGKLCEKQGAPGDCWKSPRTAYEVFGSQRFEATAPAHPPSCANDAGR